jgi:alpha-galactosidase
MNTSHIFPFGLLVFENIMCSSFVYWVVKSPLLIGCDITKMSEDTKKILFNSEVIAINQDALGNVSL